MVYARRRRFYSTRRFKRPRYSAVRQARRFRRPSYRYRRFKRPNQAVRFKRIRWPDKTPEIINIRLTYNDTNFIFSLDATVTPTDDHVFRGNSLFDPDQTGVGVQPYQFDQFSALFSQYRVNASKISVYMRPQQAYTFPIHMFIIPYQEPTLPLGDLADLKHMPFAKEVTIHDYQEYRKLKMKHYMRTHKMFPHLEQTNNNFAALTTANPAFQWYWHIIVDTPLRQPAVLQFDVKIKYYSKMLKPIVINES